MSLRVGVHVSISGGVGKAPERAYLMGCTAFQIFTRNPRGWKYTDLKSDDIELFRSGVERYGFKGCVASHMPYLPNLASPDDRIYNLSLDSLIKELERAGLLGIPYLVIHLGSHMGAGEDVGRKRLIDAVDIALSKVENDVIILLENMAGQKHSIGSRFEDIQYLIEHISFNDRIGVCFDTAHAFQAGYDLRDESSVEETLEEFDNIIGFKMLKLIHLNDSKTELGSGRDIHEHIGLGFIGEEGFKAFLRHPEVLKRPLILETPVDERREDIGNLMKVWELSGLKPPDDIKKRWDEFLKMEKKVYAKAKPKTRKVRKKK